MNIIELNYSEQNKNVPNFGIELLKTIVFFFILVYHCYDQKYCNNQILKIILEAIPLYYPTLFIISFYFSYSYFSIKNLEKIKKKFLKLIVPYIFWPIIFYIINSLLDDSKSHNYTLKDLSFQLIIGRSIACVFWFQFNLIIISIIFCLIILFSKNYYLHILGSIFFLIYIADCFQLSINFFEQYSDNINRSIGRISKMLYYSIFGFILSSFKFLPALRKYRILSIIISFSISFAIIYFKLFTSENYFYERLFMDLGALNLFVFFYMIPFENITFGPCIFFIKQITSYSNGIYFLHIKIIEYFQDSFQAFADKTLIGCALNYIICYCICFIGMKIFGKTKLKYLFIR